MNIGQPRPVFNSEAIGFARPEYYIEKPLYIPSPDSESDYGLESESEPEPENINEFIPVSRVSKAAIRQRQLELSDSESDDESGDEFEQIVPYTPTKSFVIPEVIKTLISRGNQVSMSEIIRACGVPYNWEFTCGVMRVMSITMCNRLRSHRIITHPDRKYEVPLYWPDEIGYIAEYLLRFYKEKI